jgi:hypothetical protein
MTIVEETREVIARDRLHDWLSDYPWLTGFVVT